VRSGFVCLLLYEEINFRFNSVSCRTIIFFISSQYLRTCKYDELESMRRRNNGDRLVRPVGYELNASCLCVYCYYAFISYCRHLKDGTRCTIRLWSYITMYDLHMEQFGFLFCFVFMFVFVLFHVLCECKQLIGVTCILDCSYFMFHFTRKCFVFYFSNVLYVITFL
jgi:hypothetical protein